MKIPVEIRSDEYFTKQVKNLILQRINDLLKDEKSFKDYIHEIVDKFVSRKEKSDFEKVIEEMIRNETFTERWGSRSKSFHWFVKKTIEEIAERKIKNYIDNNLFKEIKVVLKDKNE